MVKVFRRRRRRLVGLLACALAVGAVTAGGASAATWTVSMTGAKQTASGIAGDPNGTGTAYITAYPAQNQICSTVYFSNIAQPVVAAHIHEGAAGQPENPAWTINLFGPNINGTASGVSTCSIATAQQINVMKKYPQLFNVTVHNKAYPAGAIRGQLGTGTLCNEINPALCVGAAAE